VKLPPSWKEVIAAGDLLYSSSTDVVAKLAWRHHVDRFQKIWAHEMSKPAAGVGGEAMMGGNPSASSPPLRWRCETCGREWRNERISDHCSRYSRPHVGRTRCPGPVTKITKEPT
jgi:hypothetical protein